MDMTRYLLNGGCGLGWVGVVGGTFNEFVLFLQGVPEAVTCFGVELLHAFPDTLDAGAVGFMLEGTDFYLFFVMIELGPGGNEFFGNATKGTYERERHLPELKEGGHGVERPFKDLVHEEREQEVVLVMTECNLVITLFEGQTEDGFAACPRTQVTRTSSYLGVGLKTGREDVQRYVQALAESLEILRIGLVLHVFHPHMNGGHAESGLTNA